MIRNSTTAERAISLEDFSFNFLTKDFKVACLVDGLMNTTDNYCLVPLHTQ